MLAAAQVPRARRGPRRREARPTGRSEQSARVERDPLLGQRALVLVGELTEIARRRERRPPRERRASGLHAHGSSAASASAWTSGPGRRGLRASLAPEPAGSGSDAAASAGRENKPAPRPSAGLTGLHDRAATGRERYIRSANDRGRNRVPELAVPRDAHVPIDRHDEHAQFARRAPSGDASVSLELARRRRSARAIAPCARATSTRSRPCGVANSCSNSGSSAGGRYEKIPPPSLSSTTNVAGTGARRAGRSMSCRKHRSPHRPTVGAGAAACATPITVETKPSMPLAPRLASTRKPVARGHAPLERAHRQARRDNERRAVGKRRGDVTRDPPLARARAVRRAHRRSRPAPTRSARRASRSATAIGPSTAAAELVGHRVEQRLGVDREPVAGRVMRVEPRVVGIDEHLRDRRDRARRSRPCS